MPISRKQLLDDIRTELGVASRTYRATVSAVEAVDSRVIRVGFRSNRVLDSVKDRLEAGQAWTSSKGDGLPTLLWRILGVGDDHGEADVLFLVPEDGNPEAVTVGETLFLRLFNFVEPLLTSLSVESPARWLDRTTEALQWMSGERTPNLVRPADPVFRPELGAGWNAELGCIWGPPGTGKTWTLGQQVAEAAMAGRRILVTSTTNDATDVAAAEIMSALRQRGGRVTVKRVGSGLKHKKFQNENDRKFFHPSVLPEDDPDLVAEIARLEALLDRASSTNERMSLKAQVNDLRRKLADHATRYLLDDKCRVVVTTAFTAVSRLAGNPTRMQVRFRVEQGPIFDTLCIDEAGLVSAPLAASLAPYASSRMVLFGDPRQLAPIAMLSRELRKSSLAAVARPGVPTTTVLRAQRRMDPPIREVVSGYTYPDAPLQDGGLDQRQLPSLPPGLFPGELKVVFLDDAVMGSGRALPASALGAERGPGGRSYLRTGTGGVLRSVLQAYPALAEVRTAFVSPFRAQVRGIRDVLAGRHSGAPLGTDHAWSFTTVHAQQGGEAPLVLFDTVDLTKAKDWHIVDPDIGLSEWQRLLNVAISRGQRTVLVLTTRQEWRASNQPHVKRLREVVEASAGSSAYVTWNADKKSLVPVDPVRPDPLLRAPVPRKPGSLGERIEAIAAQRPVLTAEQLKLTEDTQLNGPRLVRGAPGSGKTLALAEWAVRTAADNPGARVGVVHFTSALGKVLAREVGAAGERLGTAKVASTVQVLHFHKEVLGVPQTYNDWQGELASYELCRGSVRPRFEALFVDEAQDFGPEAIRYLTKLTKNGNIRALLDPMQATGNTSVSDWSALGFDEGRVVVLRESHRSTRQIADMAMNLYAALGGGTGSMKADGLVIAVDAMRIGNRNIEILATDFVEHEGEPVEVRSFKETGESRALEYDWVAEEITRLMDERDLRAADVGIIVNPIFLNGTKGGVGKGFTNTVFKALRERLPEIALRKGLGNSTDTIEVHGLNNVKGLEFEVVFMVGADTLAPHPTKSERSIRAADLYTAATRARQKLVITGTNYRSGTDNHTGLNVLTVAGELSRRLASQDFEEKRLRRLMELTEDR